MENTFYEHMLKDAWFPAVWMRDSDQIQTMAPKNIGRVDDNGQTALMHAARRGFTELIPLLSGELKMQDQSGRTALMHAVLFGKTECVAYLLDERDVQDAEGFSAAMHSVLQNDFEAFQQLTSELNLVNNRLQTALHLAAQIGSDFFVEEIVKAAPQLLCRTDVDGRTALFYAVQHDVLELVEPLIKEAGKTDSLGFTSLRFALQAEACSVVKILTEVEGELQGLREEDIKKLVQLEAMTQEKAAQIIQRLQDEIAQAGGVVDDDPEDLYAQWLKKQKDTIEDIAEDEVQRLREQLGCAQRSIDFDQIDAELAEETMEE